MTFVFYERDRNQYRKIARMYTDTHPFAKLIGRTIDANDQVTAFIRAFAV